MATSAISATSGAAPAAPNLNLNDLLQVLLTELTNQDPLKPVDNTEFMAQIAQFTALDATQQMNTNIQQLVGLQAITQSAGLLGRTVTATTSDGRTVNGTVSALTLNSGVPQLTITALDGSGTQTPNISLGNVQLVR